jgi:hypothetical protein
MNKQLLFAFLCQACTLAFAQSPPYPGNLEVQKAGAATYVCGGVGQGEQAAMKAQAGQHSLMLTFAVSNGAYLADVDVEIKNTKGGVVLAAKCTGPIMLVDLPSGGSWQVTAQANGVARQKTISAGAGRKAQATFVWPAGSS